MSNSSTNPATSEPARGEPTRTKQEWRAPLLTVLGSAQSLTAGGGATSTDGTNPQIPS